MNCWVRVLVAAFFVTASNQVARFIRLPDGYSFMPSSGPLSQTRVPTLKHCGITATIAELKSGSVGGYIFSQYSDPNCELYTTIEKITYDGGPGGSNAWYVKIPDDVAYEGKCADQDVKRLVEGLPSNRYIWRAGYEFVNQLRESGSKANFVNFTGPRANFVNSRSWPTGDQLRENRPKANFVKVKEVQLREIHDFWGA